MIQSRILNGTCRGGGDDCLDSSAIFQSIALNGTRTGVEEDGFDCLVMNQCRALHHTGGGGDGDRPISFLTRSDRGTCCNGLV